MIGFTDKKTGKTHFVVGNFYIVDLDQNKSGGAFIIKTESAYRVYAERSVENKEILDKLDALKAERPLEWGVYEDWHRAVDLNMSKVTEAVARQYEALDYILGTSKDTGTALYMLTRIENSYKRFLTIKRQGGDVPAHQYLEKYKEQGLNDHRMSVYYARLLERAKSDIPLCTRFFQEGESYKYIKALTESQGFMKPPRIAKDKLTLNDILTEYLKTHEADPESLGLNDSAAAA